MLDILTSVAWIFVYAYLAYLASRSVKEDKQGMTDSWEAMIDTDEMQPHGPYHIAYRAYRTQYFVFVATLLYFIYKTIMEVSHVLHLIAA